MPPRTAAGINNPQTPTKCRKLRLTEEPSAPPIEPETPQKISHDLDRYIEHLNSRWNLNLPRLRGSSASQMESTDAIAKRCSARLRYLCFRADSLEPLIDEFEERAKIIHSNWTFKPQADSTLFVRRNTSEPSLSRAVIKGKMPVLIENEISKLLRCLDDVLEDPYKLARQSDSFSLTSSASVTVAVAIPLIAPSSISGPERKRTKRVAVQSPLVSDLKQPIMNNKRASTNIDTNEKSKRSKIEARPSPTDSIRRYLTTAAVASNQPLATPLNPRLPTSVQTSFDSHQSTVDSIFSSVEENSRLTTSNDTLYDDCTQDLFLTQDITELLEDPQIAVSLEAPSSGSSPRSLSDQLQQTFRDDLLRLPASINIDFAYELNSHALSAGVPSFDLWKAVRDYCQCENPNIEERLAAYTSHQYKQLTENATLETFTARSWHPAVALPPEKKSHRSVYQNLAISFDWKQPKNKSPLSLRLLPPTSDKSCRFHRQFGDRRFIQMDIPFLERGSFGDTTQSKVHQTIVEWLVGNTIRIGGRQWKPFWVEDRPKSRNGEWFNHIHLFAVTGSDLTPFNIREFMEHHIPFQSNLNTTDHKVWARFKLGLSKTTPSVVLHPDEFIEEPDILSLNGTVMNDGCSLLSLDLAKEITVALNLDYIPSVFQGRISGAKGLWLVDRRQSFQHELHGRNFWIQITPAQLKILPHPRHRSGPDAIRTFDVTRWSTALQQSTLNSQLLNVLYNRGISRHTLAERLKASSIVYFDELCSGVEQCDTLQLRFWLQRYSLYGSAKFGDIPFVGSRPVSMADQIMVLLDAGFVPSNCAYLYNLITESLKTHMNDFVDRIRIELPLSTFAYIVADPWGILEAGEIQLCLSGTWTDPYSKCEYTNIDGLDALVARNPANHPSDIQRVKLVYRLQLGHFANIAFFSTKGERPLADLLSGGDYDGDQAFICWDQALVKDFKNFELGPPDNIQPEDVGITKCSTPMSDIFRRRINDRAVDEFITKCLDFCLRPSCLGVVTNQLVNLVYHDSIKYGKWKGRNALEGHGAIHLAALASFLVDGRKAGYDLSQSAWFSVRRQLCGSVERPKPAFQIREAEVTNDNIFKESNINDYLRITARIEKQRIMADWHKKIAHSDRHDAALNKPYLLLKKQAEEESIGTRDDTLKRVCNQLKKDIDALHEQWKLKCSRKGTSINHVIHELYSEYQNIQPYAEGNQVNPFYATLEQSDAFGTPIWPILRASYLYQKHHKTAFAWALAGQELCELKAKSVVGRSIPQIQKVYGATKIDGKIIKRLAEADTSRYEEFDNSRQQNPIVDDEETRYFDAQCELQGPIVEYFYH